MTRSYLWQNDDWQTHSCNLMDYNSAGQITQSKLYDWWNDENDHSELRSHSIYSYQNSLLSELQINLYIDSQLYMAMNYHYCYDASDNLLQIDIEMTQVSSGQTIYQRSLYVYDDQNRLSEIVGEKLENEVWICNSKSLYSYDSLNRVIEILYQLLTQGNTNLQNFSKTLFSYNEQGLKAEEIGMRWTQNFTWNNSTRTLYSYQYVPNEDLIQSPQQLSLYPNPFSDQIRLQFNLKKPQNARLKIYDIKGRLIYDKNYGNFHSGNHEITFEARSSLQESLPSGIYFLSLQIGKQRIIKKAIKIK